MRLPNKYWLKNQRLLRATKNPHEQNNYRSLQKSPSTCITAPHPTDLKLKLIVAGPNSETRKWSNFVDLLLKLFQTIVRDDMELLNPLPKHTNKGICIIYFDVIKLYTAIQHQYGLEVIKLWLE